MKINLTHEHIKRLNFWLEFYSNEYLDAEHTGIYSGVKYSLQEFGIYYKVCYDREELEFEISNESLELLRNKIVDNSIEAMWNMGFAKGIVGVLQLLEIEWRK